jgi:hypothetical protein
MGPDGKIRFKFRQGKERLYEQDNWCNSGDPETALERKWMPTEQLR